METGIPSTRDSLEKPMTLVGVSPFFEGLKAQNKMASVLLSFLTFCFIYRAVCWVLAVLAETESL